MWVGLSNSLEPCMEQGQRKEGGNQQVQPNLSGAGVHTAAVVTQGHNFGFCIHSEEMHARHSPRCFQALILRPGQHYFPLLF